MLYKIEVVLRNKYYFFKGFLLSIFLLIHKCKVGKKLKCKEFPNFRSIPYNNIEIGDNVTLGKRIVLDINIGGKLIIGNNTNLTQAVLISSSTYVQIGANVLIAENVSIRDADHGTKIFTLINKQPLVSKSIIIGNDVWLGASSIILKGAKIPYGAIIGANSLVIEKSNIERNSINVGQPARHVKYRL